MADFADHFSRQAADYQEGRPTYPRALFEWLAEQAPTRALAWDCGTGNGQAAIALADYMDRVVATDASAAQLAKAPSHERVTFRQAVAESSGLPSGSVDLITVAQALHWFDLPAFFAEAERVLKRRGTLAVWTYNLLTIDPTLDASIQRFYTDVVGPYWPAERQLVETGYATVHFPCPEEPVPPFTMEASWELTRLLAYLRSWSATQRYTATHHQDPVDALAVELRAHWGEGQRHVTWPLSVRLARFP